MNKQLVYGNLTFKNPIKYYNISRTRHYFDNASYPIISNGLDRTDKIKILNTKFSAPKMLPT